ncbi:MAG: MFS transporter [Anaerolineales bacterium]|nr:MFS transporter [Anaerolineales bacterium]
MALSTFSRRDHTRNWLGFLTDYVFFSIGLTFAGTNTILPAFAANLTDNPILIGLANALWQGGWLLPQMFAAHYLSTAVRKLPTIKFFAWIGRPIFLVFGVFLLLSGAVWPAVFLLGLYFCSFYFSFTDSIAGVAWFDLLGKTFSHRERGRLIGTSQALAGILSIAAGAAIGWILQSSGLAFPQNYGLILACASVCFMISLGGMYLIREPLEPVAAERQKIFEYLPGLVRLLHEDRTFLRVNVSRLLMALCVMASPFFAVYAIRELGIAEAGVGWFAIAQTVGSALAGLLFGWVADRFGPHIVIRIVGGVYLLAPCLVLAAGIAGVSGPAQLALMAAAFLFLGLGDGSIMLGFINYVLEIAPQGQRPVYVGLTNTIVGVIVLFPFIGGALADAWGYRVVFLIAAAGIAAGWFTGASLPSRAALFASGQGTAPESEPPYNKG